MWQVPLFDISFDEAEYRAVQQVLRSGWLTMGDVTRRFEERFAEVVGVKHAVAVSSGTAALHLANCALGIGPGDEVLCPSLTFAATANAIIYAGGSPVFVDIAGNGDLTISPRDIEQKITDRTRAIMVMHYAGFPCAMEDILALARQNGLAVIEDCAHSLGTICNGKHCGSLGMIGCFSFFSNKNITTGEGGMVTTDDDAIAEQVRRMRSHGMTTLTIDRHRGHAFSYDVVDLGYNYRIDEMRAAIGTIQLDKLSGFILQRKRKATLYQECLHGIDLLTLPSITATADICHHIFPVILDARLDREKFMTFLKKQGIQSSIHYPPVHLFSYYRERFGHAEGLLPVTEEIARREVTLPLYPAMDDDAIRYVCNKIKHYVTHGDT